MSDRPIRKGDMVLVVKTCCTGRVSHRSFYAEAFIDERHRGQGYCMDCRAPMPIEIYWGPVAGFAQPASWLRRINDPDHTEEIQESEGVTA